MGKLDWSEEPGGFRPVFVYRLICEGSIEERIRERQKRKAGLVEGVLSGNTNQSKIRRDDQNRSTS